MIQLALKSKSFTAFRFTPETRDERIEKYSGGQHYVETKYGAVLLNYGFWLIEMFGELMPVSEETKRKYFVEIMSETSKILVLGKHGQTKL